MLQSLATITRIVGTYFISVIKHTVYVIGIISKSTNATVAVPSMYFLEEYFRKGKPFFFVLNYISL